MPSPSFRTPVIAIAASVASVGRALRHPAYRTYALGGVISLIGSWMHRVALGWLTWELTQSGTWLGAIAFADLLPTVVIGPIAGVIADRRGRVRLLMATQVVSLVLVAILAARVWSGSITIELLFLNTLLLGVAMGFAQPVRLALMPSLVPREDLSAAIAFNSLMFNSGRLIGPVAAGAVIVAGDTGLAFALNAVSFVAFLAALVRLDRMALGDDAVTDISEPDDRRRATVLLHGFIDGVRYAIRHRGIAPLLVVFGVTAAFGRPFAELLAGIAAQVYGSGAEGLAALTTASGIGALMASARMAHRRSAGGTTRLVVHHLPLLALAVAVLVATERMALGLASAALAGYAMVVCAVGTQILIQMTVAGAMRARVLSLYGLVLRGGVAIGALAMGALADLWGLAPPLLLGAAICLMAYGWAAWALGGLARTLEGEESFRPSAAENARAGVAK